MTPLVNNLIRVIDFIKRFLIGIENIGLVGAVKIFFLYRSRDLNGDTCVYIRKLRRPFFFRGAADKGVMSHFYKPGYRLRENHSTKVNFILDAGANIGDETVRFRFFHPNATIVALEPAADNFRLLKKNILDDPKISPLQKGLWSRECYLKVIPGTTNEGFKVVEVNEPDQGYDVLATSVDSIMKQFGVSEIDILKLDIEGAEYQVFSENCESWIKNVKVFIFECPDNDYPGTTSKIFQVLGNLKFSCYIQGENLVLIRSDLPWTVESDLYLVV